MIDLRKDLGDLYRTLSQTPASGGGRLVMLMSSRAGEGTSTIIRSLALIAAEKSRRPVWLIDLDLKRNETHDAFAQAQAVRKHGGVGRPYLATLGVEPFFSLEPKPEPNDPDASGMFTVHRVGETSLMVTRFDTARLKPGRAVRIRTSPAYWTAIRATTDWVFVDAPALERSSAGLAVASQMDRCVVVVEADSTTPSDVEQLRRELVAHGGTVAGAAFNRVRADARLADRLAW